MLVRVNIYIYICVCECVCVYIYIYIYIYAILKKVENSIPYFHRHRLYFFSIGPDIAIEPNQPFFPIWHNLNTIHNKLLWNKELPGGNVAKIVDGNSKTTKSFLLDISQIFDSRCHFGGRTNQCP